MKRSRILVSALAAMVVATALVGCGKKETPQNASETKGGKKIIVWSHLTDDEVAAVKPIAEEWAKSTGNTVDVLADKGDFNAFAQAANSSKAADVMFGLAHDNLGAFVKAGVVAEVPSGIVDSSKYNQNVVNAVTIGGKTYGVPLSQETLALFYNPDKVATAPTTLDDLIAQGKKVGFKYEAKNLYYTYAFLSGFGGYIYKDNGGNIDPKDVGLGNEGAIKGYDVLSTFGKDLGMKSSVDQGIAGGEFKAGKIGMYISGPWDVEGFKKENTKFKVAPLPSINGKPATPFLGVQAAFVNSKSKNQTEAWDLMKYLVAHSEQALYDKGHRIPALKDSKLLSELSKGDLAAFIEQAKTAYPMPNIPEMGAAWKVNDSLPTLLDGKMDSKAFATKVVKDINDQLSQQAK